MQKCSIIFDKLRNIFSQEKELETLSIKKRKFSQKFGAACLFLLYFSDSLYKRYGIQFGNKFVPWFQKEDDKSDRNIFKNCKHLEAD